MNRLKSRLESLAAGALDGVSGLSSPGHELEELMTILPGRALCCVALMLTACIEDNSTTPPRDAVAGGAVADASSGADAAPVDVGPSRDARPADSSPPDAGRPLVDGSPSPDAGRLDAQPFDAAQPLDAAEPADAAQPLDAAPADAGPPPGRFDGALVDWCQVEAADFGFFVTSMSALWALAGDPLADLGGGFGGDFGGLAGADEICQTIGEATGHGYKRWRAFLSATDDGAGQPVHAIERIGAGPWHDANGRLVARDLAGLAGDRPDGDPASVNDLPDECGVPLSALGDAHDVPTGSDRQGRLRDPDPESTCNDWTSSDGRVGGDGSFGGGLVFAGHSFPRSPRSGRNWMSDHQLRGCGKGANLLQNGAGEGSCIGCTGGYGALYCFAEDGPAARACYAYCRAVTECDPAGDRSLRACRRDCAEGFAGADGLRLAAASECLAAQAPNGACDALRGCLPAQLAVDCGAHCAALERCGVPAEGCAAACAAGEVSLDVAGCVADTTRTNSGCAAVAACVGHQQPPAPPLCAHGCALRAACDADFDEHLCRTRCTPAPPALPIQVACAEASACGPRLEACFDLPADLNPGCVDACEGVEACNLFPAPSACVTLCTGQAASARFGDDWPDRLGACFAAARMEGGCDVAAAVECLVPASCEGHGDVLLVPPDGGRFELDTRGRPNLYGGRCGSRGAGPEVVLALTTQGRARVTATVTQADYDTELYVRRGDCDDAAAEIACNDDADRTRSRVAFDAVADTYYIFLDGFGGGGAGRATLVIVVEPR